MNFNFILDKKYLIFKMINNRGNLKELEEWIDITVQKSLNKTFITNIKSFNVEEDFINGTIEKFIIDNKINQQIEELFDDTLFEKYYNETENYLNNVKRYWFDKKDIVINYLTNTIKVMISNKPINVYISHPILNTGKCVNQTNIFFGHYKGIKDLNYNIVYLTHEYLHSILPSDEYIPTAMKLYYLHSTNDSNYEYWHKLNKEINNYYIMYEFEFDIIHAIIELISDNELYTRLNNISMYDIGHHSTKYNLTEYKKIIIPYWFKYLNLNKEEINQRCDIDNYTSITDNLNNITNIYDFIEFILNKTNLKELYNIPNIDIKV